MPVHVNWIYFEVDCRPELLHSEPDQNSGQNLIQSSNFRTRLKSRINRKMAREKKRGNLLITNCNQLNSKGEQLGIDTYLQSAVTLVVSWIHLESPWLERSLRNSSRSSVLNVFRNRFQTLGCFFPFFLGSGIS